jgi:hypothetical protein
VRPEVTRDEALETTTVDSGAHRQRARPLKPTTK